MRWVVDTSAWSRRGRPEVVRQLETLLRDDGDELVLSPAVELEILREPQWAGVADRRRALEEAMDVLDVTSETFAIAADVMERLAMHAATAHRRPLADLVTAALAHQHGCGIVHHDGDFELIAAHGGLDVTLLRLELDGDPSSARAHPARRQRRLRDELAVLVHQLPVPEAEMFLEDAVLRASALVARQRRS